MSGNEKFVGGYDNRFNTAFNHQVNAGERARLAWFERNFNLCFAKRKKDEVPRAARKLMDMIEASKVGCVPRVITRPEGPKEPPKRVILATDPDIFLDIMKPVPPEIHALIYDGISHNEEGRYKYLKHRFREDPDDKFYTVQCDNWVYGWGINSYDLTKLKKMPRIGVIHQSFYRRNGVQPDPEHYRDPVFL